MSETRVLLVDDEEDFVAVLAERLSARGLEVDIATSGEAALEKAAEHVYDAVVLDMAMPGLDGIQTLKGLKQITPEQQVIMLTGRATVSQAVEAMKAGALDLVEKPAEMDELVSLIDDAARRRASLDDQRMQRRIDEITRKRGW
ncbi:MAG: response regulator [Longimicrobiales bacterium]